MKNRICPETVPTGLTLIQKQCMLQIMKFTVPAVNCASWTVFISLRTTDWAVQFLKTTVFSPSAVMAVMNMDVNTLDASSQKTYDGGYETARQSYFGRLQYDYMSKYLFEANFRADASSLSLS